MHLVALTKGVDTHTFLSWTVQKDHTFLSILFESDEQGKSSHFQVGCSCMLRIPATCAIPKWS